MKKRRFRKRKVLAVLVVAPILLFALVQTPPGKAALAKALSSALSSSEHLHVRVSGLSGWLPAQVGIESLEVGDAEGTWLVIRNAQCRWMIRDMMDQRITFRQLSAEEVEWSRFPKGGTRDPDRPRRTGEFEPVEVALEGLKIKHFRVGRRVAGTDLEYTVSSGGVVYQTDGDLAGELAVRGDADGIIRLNASLTGAASDALHIGIDARRMLHPTFGLDFLAGEGEATIDAEGVRARIVAELSKNGQQGRIDTQLTYADRALALSDLTFESPDFSLGGDLSLGFRKGAIDVQLDASFVDVHTNHYEVDGVAVVATSNKTWGVEVGRIDIQGWDVLNLHLSGGLSPELVALQGELRPFDFGTIPYGGCSNFTGEVTGSIAVNGDMTEPEVVARVNVQGLASCSDALDELPELDFNIAGGASGGRLFAATSITNYASGFFSAAFDMPCELSFAPLKYRPVPKEVEVEVEGDLDLGVLNQLAVFQNQLIRGVLKTRVAYAAGKPEGFLRVENGHYEHYDWGVVFHDFNADLEATPEGFRVNTASATDGRDGSLGLSGGLSARGLDLKLLFDTARVIRRDEMEASMSGWLGVTGPLARPDISGELTIDRAEILLDNIAPPPPPLLTNYDASKTNWVGHAVQTARKPPPVGLDIKILMPAQVFVIASMIETTLEGNLHITDAPNGVSVEGRIEPRRGFVNFIGKKFRFTEGDILLDGSIPTLAILNNLTAEYARRDVTARLVLNGPANDPRFRLESSPPLPEDEVLSHVLFNRDTSSISPYQAYQIAMAARQLSGGLNGPGFMFQVRQAIGVDTLEWREADAAGGSSSVAAGKYLASGLYVEVNRELDARGQTGLMAEFEVTRHFSVETYTGPKLRPGIGINWRNDY